MLAIAFAGDMAYTRRVPNVGEGITDYEAYKQSALVREISADIEYISEYVITDEPEIIIK